MRISDWSSDVCSSDLQIVGISLIRRRQGKPAAAEPMDDIFDDRAGLAENQIVMRDDRRRSERRQRLVGGRRCPGRSEEHTSELQSLMRSSYAVICLKQNNSTLTSLTLLTNTIPSITTKSLKHNKTHTTSTPNTTQQ